MQPCWSFNIHTPEPEPLLIPSVPVLCIGYTYLFHYAITETLYPKRGFGQADGLIYRSCLYFCVGEYMCTWSYRDISMSIVTYRFWCVTFPVKFIHGVCGDNLSKVLDFKFLIISNFNAKFC